MSIKLNWVHHAAENPDGFRIYRSTSPIPDTPLPTPLVQLAGDVREYLDTTTLRNVLYYYRIEVFKGSENSLSVNHKLAYMPYTGPGPSKILRGDSEIGFFGTLPIDQLIHPIDLAAKLNFPSAWTIWSNATKWFKVMRKGKVLFVPDNAITPSASMAALYQNGLLYGTADSNKYHDWMKTNYGTINNYRTVVIGENEYLVRCPGSRLVPGSLGGSTTDYVGGEYDDVIAPLYAGRTVKVNNTQYFDDNHSNNYRYTTDMTVAGTALVRGSSSGDGTATNSAASAVGTIGFYPVLELLM